MSKAIPEVLALPRPPLKVDFSRVDLLTRVVLVAGGVLAGVALAPLARKAWEKIAGKGGGRFSGINSDKSGARFEADLPQGANEVQLYSLATPNGQKVTIALEELGIKYDAYYINIMKGDQFSSGFVRVNPNSKIPALLDKNGPGGREVRVFESGAILLYLAEKAGGKLLPKDPIDRQECICWLFFQMGAGPFFGQYGHFTRYAPVRIEYAERRYKMETQRLLDVLEKRLVGREYLVGGEFTVADIAWYPWVRGLDVFYEARQKLEIDERYPNVVAWLERISNRPAVQKGLKINQPNGEFQEYHS